MKKVLITCCLGLFITSCACGNCMGKVVPAEPAATEEVKEDQPSKPATEAAVTEEVKEDQPSKPTEAEEVEATEGEGAKQ